MSTSEPVPEFLSKYMEVKETLDAPAAAALKKWAANLTQAEASPREEHKCCCCCCCCCDHENEDKHNRDFTVGAERENEFTFKADIVMLYVDPNPPRPIVDLDVDFSWSAPPGSQVDILMEVYRPDGEMVGQRPIYTNLSASGFRLWRPDFPSSYGTHVCFKAVTNTGLQSKTICRSSPGR